MFLFVSVILFTGGGGSAPLHAGIYPPGTKSRHPLPGTKSRHPPGTKCRHPPPPGPKADTPAEPKADTPGTKNRHPRDQKQNPPPPRHTVNERPVRILLECILACFEFLSVGCKVLIVSRNLDLEFASTLFATLNYLINMCDLP